MKKLIVRLWDYLITLSTGVSESQGGGVMIAVNRRFRSGEVTCTNSCEILSVNIHISATVIRLIVTYLPHFYDTEHVSNFFTELGNLIPKQQTTLIFGDFNAPLVDWNSLSFPETKNYKTFYKFYLKSQPLTQFITHPTRGLNVLDLLFSNDSKIVKSIEHLPPIATSDHEVLYGKLAIKRPKHMKIFVKNFNKGNYKLAELIISKEIHSLFCSDRIENIWARFKIFIDLLIKVCVPTKRKLAIGKSLYSRTDTHIYNRYKYFYKNHKLKQSDYSLLQYKAVKRFLKSYVINSKIRYETELAKSKSKGSLFRYVRSHTRESTTDIPPLIINNEIITDNQIKANHMVNYFSSIGSTNGSSATFKLQLIPRTAKVIITANMITSSLKQCKSKFSSGPDGIPSIFWKKVGHSLSPFLSFLFTRMIEENYVPPEWKCADIIPIYKGKGKQSDISNYRPISLTCSLSKIFETVILHLINSDVQPHLSTNKHGFRESKSTITNLISTYHVNLENMNKKLHTDVIYIDLSKAFDRVSHYLLMEKLSKFNIHPDILKIIYSFISNRKICVKIDNVRSKPEILTCGVPQGSILGPILFVIYINELFELPLSSNINGYADDTKLFGTNPVFLQSDLNIVVDWLKNNLMVINTDKCVCLHFGNDNPKTTYYLLGKPLQSCSKTKDLGVIIDDRLNFDSHIRSVVKRSFYIINTFFRIFKSKNTEMYILLYKLYVLPVIQYGSLVYWPVRVRDIMSIEKIQRYFTRALYRRQIPKLNYTQRQSKSALISLELKFLHTALFTAYRLNFSNMSLDIQVFNRSRINPNRFTLCHSKLAKFHDFFTLRVANVWNHLSLSDKSLENLTTFKKFVCSSDLSRFMKGHVS